MAKICLGVDVGGTGCKCVAFSRSGEQLASCYQEYPLPAGAVNLPPETLVTSVYQVIRSCAARLETPSEIAAVTVSSFGESFVAVDDHGEPLDDIRMYFGDSESAAFDALVQTVGAQRFMEICRILPDASYSLAKMLYTQEIAQKPKFLFIAGFLCWKLSGRICTDVSLACRTLLYDVTRGCWSRELLQAASIREEQLPQVVQPGAALGAILPDVAHALGLPENTVVVLGTHDQIVNALGAGVENIGDAVDTSGTCECITPLFPAIPEGLDFQHSNFACVPYLNRGYVTYAYNISAGSVVRWYRDALAWQLKQDGKSVYDVLNELSPSEPTNLMVLPFLQGMGGTPDVDPKATGLIAGLTTQTRLPDIYRAILEGITFEMRYNQEKLAESGVTITRLFACGGGARSRVWLQIKADILGCPMIPLKTEETGAMGSAILGFAAVTGEDPFAIAKAFRDYGEPVMPNQKHQEFYNRRFALYKKLRAFYKEI
ncbi:MAG: FGGY-family carbohydrate kinase [Candidatus Faecousia sp.]|nr:FGGY-family carbohydrate kinase [Candidatus Faecousia sp.]